MTVLSSSSDLLLYSPERHLCHALHSRGVPWVWPTFTHGVVGNNKDPTGEVGTWSDRVPFSQIFRLPPTLSLQKDYYIITLVKNWSYWIGVSFLYKVLLVVEVDWDTGVSLRILLQLFVVRSSVSLCLCLSWAGLKKFVPSPLVFVFVLLLGKVRNNFYWNFVRKGFERTHGNNCNAC